MADGAVRFVSEMTPPDVLRQVALMADGESPLID